ncbi:MAG: hypothetical protein RL738_227, partial [Bacteroidota bacterium]
VTSRTAMPAILIELGFLTNSAEEDFLMTDDGQDQMAQAIARSFAQYKVRREGGIPNEAPVAAKPTVPAPAVVPAVEAPVQAPAEVATAKPASPQPTAPEPEATEAAPVVSDVFYSVQLSVSGLLKSPNEEPFNALPGVFYLKDGRLYRYLAGRHASREAAVAALAQARAKGFPDAFLVAYRGTARITLDEAEQALKKP